jgi:hypothetical protein
MAMEASTKRRRSASMLRENDRLILSFFLPPVACVLPALRRLGCKPLSAHGLPCLVSPHCPNRMASQMTLAKSLRWSLLPSYDVDNTVLWNIDGETVSLSDIIGMGIVVVPHRPSTSPSSTLSSTTPRHSPDNANITDLTTYEPDHIPLSPDSPFPLLIRDSNPVVGSSLGVVWTIHPCAVGTHVGELVGDTESPEHEGEQGEQADRERRRRSMERWMDVWLGLHSRILPDLAR